MICRRHKSKTSVQNAAITESPQAAFARHRRTALGREVLRYNDHVPEFPSSTFLDRFVDFPFDVAARFAELNARRNPFFVMKTLHSCPPGTIPCVCVESARLNRDTRHEHARPDAMRRGAVGFGIRGLIRAGRDEAGHHPRLGCRLVSSGPDESQGDGSSAEWALVEIREDFMDDDSFELFRLALDARYAPQMADEALLTAPEWVRQKYLPLFYSGQAVLTIAMSLPFPNADAWREQHAREARQREERERRSCTVARLLALGYQCALQTRQPRLARQLRSTAKGDRCAVVEKVVTMRSTVDPETGEHYSYRQILHDFGRPVNRAEINLHAQD